MGNARLARHGPTMVNYLLEICMFGRLAPKHGSALP